ncbi:MAG: sigma-54-dependent Fis family transcriptional regulator [Deltaproteobacteria bacterium]|nr:MAG: sigma-54-dependent Fis family transcriptional regulator [Deltaproteobacteria bacterium]
MRGKKILLVENDSQDRSTISEIFIESGHCVSIADDALSAFEKIVRDNYDLVIAELNLPQMNGIDLLKRIKEVNESIPVILISANPRVKEAVEAMKMGAYDFILKPLTVEIIEIVISQISDSLTVGDKDRSEARFTIITRDREMNRLLKEARDIAKSQASVFIQGESGTGKELFARYIHHHSDRRGRPFVPINCSALPETLLESELFGHEKGSFTGALTRKKGKFEIANHGTILLDEISEMDIQPQSKLLRVLQEREIDRIGGISPVPVDVRIIATTNGDIEELLKDGKFREDLYYRLNVILFHLPPLRERKDDIPLLANYFIEKYNRIDKRNVRGLTEEVMQLLMQMPWKGNIRELENIIERAVLRCKGELIDQKDISISEKDRPAEDRRFTFVPTVSLKEMEKKVIYHALDQTNGNRTHAAEILGISVRTLRNKLNEYRKKMEAQ